MRTLERDCCGGGDALIFASMDRSLAQDKSSREVVVPQPGDVIHGKYRIEKVLGEGGMGVVLAAHHELLDQRVAVKVLTSRDEKAVSRFSLEARSTARLNSEHVARVMDVGALACGAPFIVMEYLEGCDLEELLLLHERLPPQEAVGYILQALQGLAQAHALGIIHRDLKPANLFIAVVPGGANVIKILDFGISKSTASRRSGKTGNLTAEHSTLGSPTYMSPEQIRASKDVDTRSDLWSLGVVLFELLAGAPPFDGESVGEIFANVLEKDVPALTTVRPDVPEGLSDVIARCVKRDPTERFPGVLEFARELAPFGPADAASRVRRIEQTLLTARTKAGGSEPPPSTVRPVMPSGRGSAADETAEETTSGSHDVHFSTDAAEEPAGAASTPALPRRHRGPQVTGHVAFASDKHKPDLRALVDTGPSLARRSRGRAVIGVVCVAAVFAVLAIAALVRTDLSGRASPSVANASGAPPTAPASSTTVPAPAASPQPEPTIVRPLAAAAAHASQTPAKPTSQPQLPVAPRRTPASMPGPAKKHLGVLDSPD
jgi:serine/threonine protein kinase